MRMVVVGMKACDGALSDGLPIYRRQDIPNLHIPKFARDSTRMKEDVVNGECYIIDAGVEDAAGVARRQRRISKVPYCM